MAYVAVNIGFVGPVHDPFVRVEERVRIGGPVFVMAHFVVEPVVFAGRGGFAAGFGLLAVLLESFQVKTGNDLHLTEVGGFIAIYSK